MTTKRQSTPRNLYYQKVANLIRSGDPSGIQQIVNILNRDAIEGWRDDFEGDAIADEWRANADGTGGTVASSLYTLTTVSDSTDYSFLVGNIGWLPSKNCFMQTLMRINTSATDMRLEMGFTSAVATTGAVAALGDPGWAPTFTDTDAVIFIWDTATAHTTWSAVSAYAKEKVETDVAPEVDTFHLFGVGINGTTANFYIDGRRVAVINAPTTATTTSLAPYVGIKDRGRVSVVDFDYILTLQSRRS